jgi:hypothetical protein
VCVAEALTNSLYVDPDELTGKLDPSLSAYLMPRNVDTEAAAPRGTHYALRLCTNYTELRCARAAKAQGSRVRCCWKCIVCNGYLAVVCVHVCAARV